MENVCRDNNVEYSNKEPNIKEFEKAITLLEHLDVTKITRGKTKIDYDIVSDGYSCSQFSVYYEENILCTLLDRETEERYETKCSLGYALEIKLSDFFNELFHTIRDPNRVDIKGSIH